MSTAALALHQTNIPWRKRLTDMLFISHLSTKTEIENAYQQERARLDAADPQNDLERKLLMQKRHQLDQAYDGYQAHGGAADDAACLKMAYDEAAAARAMRLASVPFVLWLLSRIINIPLNCIQDCTRCSCCGDESIICCLHKDCANNAYDNSNTCKVIDTVLFGVVVLAVVVAIIIAIVSKVRSAAEEKQRKRELARRAEVHRREMEVYQAYYNRMSDLRVRYNQLTKEFPNLAEMPKFLSATGRFLDAVDKIRTNEALDLEYRTQCDQMKRNYIDFWMSNLRKLQADVDKANREKPSFSELTEEETSRLSEFQQMISSLARIKV